MALFTDYIYDSDSTAAEEEGNTPLCLPTAFCDIPSYVESLPYPTTRFLGTYDTETIRITLTGHIPANDAEDLVHGRALIKSDTWNLPGYVIGVITGTDTAVVVSQDLKMYAYDPPRWPWSDYEAWKAMEGHLVAEILVDSHEREIRLRFLSDIQIVCN
jgi:hypothetical protein